MGAITALYVPYRDSQTCLSTNPVLFQTVCRLTYLMISGCVHLDVPGSSRKNEHIQNGSHYIPLFHKLFLLHSIPQSVARSLYSVTRAGNHPIGQPFSPPSTSTPSDPASQSITAAETLGILVCDLLTSFSALLSHLALGGIPYGSTTLLQPASFPTFQIKRNSLFALFQKRFHL